MAQPVYTAWVKRTEGTLSAEPTGWDEIAHFRSLELIDTASWTDDLWTGIMQAASIAELSEKVVDYMLTDEAFKANWLGKDDTSDTLRSVLADDPFKPPYTLGTLLPPPDTITEPEQVVHLLRVLAHYQDDLISVSDIAVMSFADMDALVESWLELAPTASSVGELASSTDTLDDNQRCADAPDFTIAPDAESAGPEDGAAV